MNTQMNERAAENSRQWKRPEFTRLGGLSQVASTCQPGHLPGGPICAPS